MLPYDLRYGARMLARSPGFTAVAMLSLGLGVCIGTSAFSELNGLALRKVPGVHQPEELVAIRTPTSYPHYLRFRELSDVFSATLAYAAPVPFGVSRNGRTERTWGHLATASYFSTLGVGPFLGRVFDEREERPGRAPVVVVSYRFWQNRLGADPSIAGKSLRINGDLATIVGVAPKSFLGASPMLFAADIWLPLSAGLQVAPELADSALERPNVTMFHVVGRLRKGVDPARAEAALDTVARQLERSYGRKEQPGRSRVSLAPAGRLLPIRTEDLPAVTAIPMVLVGLVLLIACSNVGNMMVARAAERRREIAVRLALGASRGRIVRQLLAESMLVAAGAGALGFVMSCWLMRLGSQVRIPYPMPVVYDLTPDGRAIAFTVALAALTGLGFGLAPALHATRIDLAPALKEGGAVRFFRYRWLSLRNLLLLHQVAGSVALLLLIVFVVFGVKNTMGIELGFDPRNLYVVSLDPIREGYTPERARTFFEKLLERTKGMPGVTAAALTDTVPAAMNGNRWSPFSAAGTEPGSPRAVHGAVRYVVGRDYFDALGVPILLGRGFRKEDEADDAQAVIVSERVAREYWKGEDPLGRRIEIGDGAAAPSEGIYISAFDARPGATARRREFEVVGVARDTKADLTIEGVPPILYFPLRPADYAQPSLHGVTLLVRAAPGVDALALVRRELSALDPNLTPLQARAMPDQVDEFLFLYRVVVGTYAAMGLFGLILSSVGLAGLTAYTVARRRREIGIRIALGAQRGQVLGLALKEAAALVGAGAAIGLALAWGGVRLLSATASSLARSMGESASNPLLLAGAPLLLATLALAACYVPARKSTRIEPAAALREE